MGKQLAQPAGACGTIQFDLFSKPCTYYMRADATKNLCAEKCLPNLVGKCNTKDIIVKNGNLVPGRCSSLGYTQDNKKQLAQAAGACGTIQFDLFSKPCTYYMRADA